MSIGIKIKLERIVVDRPGPEAELIDAVELGGFVAVVAPPRFGRSTVLRAVHDRLERAHPQILPLRLRIPQGSGMPLEDYLRALVHQVKRELEKHGFVAPSMGSHPYLELKHLLCSLVELTGRRVLLAIEDFGKVDRAHEAALVDVLTELHAASHDKTGMPVTSTRDGAPAAPGAPADPGAAGGPGLATASNAPASALALLMAGSRRLFEIGQPDGSGAGSSRFFDVHYLLPGMTVDEVQRWVTRVEGAALLKIDGLEESCQALVDLTGGHPALVYALLTHLALNGSALAPASASAAAQAVARDDETLSRMWKRIRGEEAAIAQVRRVFLGGHRPGAHIAALPEAVLELFWAGLIVPRGERLEPCGRMVEAFVRDQLDAIDAERTAAGHAAMGQAAGHTLAGQATGGPATTSPTTSATGISQAGHAVPTGLPDGSPRSVYPQQLIDAFRQGQGVLLLGSGISRAAGLPDNRGLSALMARRLLDTVGPDQGSALEAYLQRASPPAIARQFKQKVFGAEFQGFLREHLRKEVLLPPLHRALGRLPVHIVLTTALDKLIERAFRPAGGDDPPVILTTAAMAGVDGNHGVSIVKLMGDVDHPESIVLTADEYAGFAERKAALRGFLEHQIHYRTLLIVGFQPGDPDFELVFQQHTGLLEAYRRPAYALTTKLNPFDADDWARAGIKTIEVAREEDLAGFVEGLAGLVGNAP